MHEPSGRPSLRQLIREYVRDQEGLVEVLSVAAASGGWFILGVGLLVHERLLTMIGGLALASLCALAWTVHEPEPPSRPYASAPGRSEIRRMTDEEFDLLLDEVERQARMPFPPPAPVGAGVDTVDGEFAQIVRDALDELPEFVQDELRRGNLAVTLSDYGSEWNAYGLYTGGTSAHSHCHHVITIFRDTLTAHFGSDVDELRRQVRITVRHEVAHHFGADERRVRALGL